MRWRGCVAGPALLTARSSSRTKRDAPCLIDRFQRGPRVKADAFLFAFDMIELDGDDMRQMPLLTRKSRLLKLVQGAPAGIVFNEHMEGDGPTVFRHACELGCEGIVSKRADSPYRSGRSRNWIKTKAPAAIEAQKSSF
jgi:ATP-dependent DNA ligase